VAAFHPEFPLDPRVHGHPDRFVAVACAELRKLPDPVIAMGPAPIAGLHGTSVAVAPNGGSKMFGNRRSWLLGAFLFCACRVENYEGVQPDDESCQEEQEAAQCETAADCEQGFECIAGACRATAKEICQLDVDCAAGSFCDPGASECLASNVCADEAECAPGFNCDAERGTCTPAASGETCAEIADEAACAQRPDCTLVYAGVDCSCGAGCECVGGEPNCVCEAFEFFRCEVNARS
jgi:hypothetical protein